jgi:hypothetical protein
VRLPSLYSARQGFRETSNERERGQNRLTLRSARVAQSSFHLSEERLVIVRFGFQGLRFR